MYIMIIYDNENKNGKFLCASDVCFHTVTNLHCGTFQNADVPKTGHRAKKKHKEHEPVAFHQLVSRSLQKDKL
jgi:hypothetical protein